MTLANTANRAPRPSGLADVLELVLDKGIVIDAYVRLALVGIEILTLDARVVIASVDTYLRFAEAVNRLDLQPQDQAAGLPGLMREVTEGGARSKAKGALSGVRDTVSGALGGGSNSGGDQQDSGDDEPRRRRPARATASSAGSGSSSSDDGGDEQS